MINDNDKFYSTILITYHKGVDFIIESLQILYHINSCNDISFFLLNHLNIDNLVIIIRLNNNTSEFE